MGVKKLGLTGVGLALIKVYAGVLSSSFCEQTEELERQKPENARLVVFLKFTPNTS